MATVLGGKALDRNRAIWQKVKKTFCMRLTVGHPRKLNKPQLTERHPCDLECCKYPSNLQLVTCT
jgi:hypothetical protein